MLVVKQKVILEKYKGARMPKSMIERVGRLRERQTSGTVAKPVLILTKTLI